MNLQTILLICFLGLQQSGFSKTARNIYLNDKKTEAIRIGTGHSTILNFPTRPSKVVLGNKGLFGIEYIENDLAITALNSHGKSNLFVYLDGRRFGFDLLASSEIGDEIVVVRDVNEKKVKVRMRIKDE